MNTLDSLKELELSGKMTYKQIRKAIRDCNAVFGWIALTDGDGEYIQLQKGSILSAITDKTVKYNAKMANSILYIN